MKPSTTPSETTEYPTDAALAAAVAEVFKFVREKLSELKAAVPDLVSVLTNEEWTALKDGEERRRADKRSGPGTWEGSDKPGAFWKECTARLERVRGNKSAPCRFPYCDCAKLSAEEKAEW